MKRKLRRRSALILLGLVAFASSVLAQPARPPERQPEASPQDVFPPPDGPPGFDGPPPFGPDGFGPGGRRQGPGGFGGVRQKTALVKQFDRNGDGWLNNDERKTARAFLRTNETNGRHGGPRRP